jgi:quercetin dioxygenase-like cupin family protein
MYFYDRASMQEHHQVGGGRRYVASGDRMMMMLLELPPGAVVPMHSHPHEQLGIVLEGEFELIIGSERRDMKAGDMYIIPGGVPHQAIGSQKKALFFDVWSPPREELLD